MVSKIAPAADSAKLIDVIAVAELLTCSPRHVYRLSDGGKMPAPLKLGSLSRWSAAAIRQWIAEDCIAVRRTGR